MGRSLATALVVSFLAFAVSGCIIRFDDKEKATDDQPHNPSRSTDLLGYYTINYHAPRFEVYAAPPLGAEPAAPDSCIAFRNDTRHESDSCQVLEGAPQYRDLPSNLGPWLIHAVWEGDRFSNEFGDSWMNVVCYDDAGQTIASWNGAYHPDASHLTE